MYIIWMYGFGVDKMEDTVITLTKDFGITGGTILFLLIFFSKRIEQLTSLLMAVKNLQEKRQDQERRLTELEKKVDELTKKDRDRQ